MTINGMVWLKSLWQFAVRVGRRFFADACSGRAAGLAFSTLFALVPLSAFVVAVLNAFGAFDPLIEEAQAALIEQLVPAVHEQVFESISQFASNTRALGFLGLFIFLATAVLLLRNINISLNAIWRFRSRRGAWAKIASYTTIIVIGTTLISASFVLGPLVQSVIEAALPHTARSPWLRGFILPPLFLFLTLMVLNMLVPAGKVRTSSAAIGAAVTVVVWELGKRIFVFWSTSVMRFNLMYGSLAVLPIFLIWLYLSWFFVLVGVEVAYAFQHRRESTGEEEHNSVDGPVSTVLEHCIATACEIGRRHRAGEPPITSDLLDYNFGAGMADRVRTSLAESGLFLDTDHGLLPARGWGTITVDDLVSSVITGRESESKADTADSGEPPAHRAEQETGPVGVLLGIWRRDPSITLSDDRLAECATGISLTDPD